MKMKDKEQIIFTPGLDSRSLKMDYYDIDNMVIVGTTGSGKTTALNAIVKSMIESNSSEYLLTTRMRVLSLIRQGLHLSMSCSVILVLSKVCSTTVYSV